MAISFNSDGSVTRSPDEIDVQEDLANDLVNHKSHINSGYQELRILRDNELKTSDWTQVPDSPLDSTTKAAWATYRTELRDLPSSAKAPYWFVESDWPKAPGQSDINPEALSFIDNHADLTGIGTTSWVGLTTALLNQHWTSLTTNPIGVTTTGVGVTNIIGVASTDNIEIGDWVRTNNAESDVGTVAGIGTTTITLDGLNLVYVGEVKVDFARVVPQYYAQDRPEFGFTVTPQPYTIVRGGNVNFTINTTNQQIDEEFTYAFNGDADITSDRSGELVIIPNGLVGVATITVGVSSVTLGDKLILSVDCVGLSGVTTSVGVSTV